MADECRFLEERQAVAVQIPDIVVYPFPFQSVEGAVAESAFVHKSGQTVLIGSAHGILVFHTVDSGDEIGEFLGCEYGTGKPYEPRLQMRVLPVRVHGYGECILATVLHPFQIRPRAV